MTCRFNRRATDHYTAIRWLVHWPLMAWLLGYIWYSEVGPGWAAAPPSPLLAVPYVTAHPSTASVYQLHIIDLLTSAADIPGRPALRTASRGDFIVPRTNRKFGDRAFCDAAPRVWNRLPADLRQLRSTQTFRRHLKTFLFAASYWALINRHSWTM